MTTVETIARNRVVSSRLAESIAVIYGFANAVTVRGF